MSDVLQDRYLDKIDTLERELATATERATKAEAGMGLAVRALVALQGDLSDKPPIVGLDAWYQVQVALRDSDIWAALNRERGILIDKNIAGTITSEEQKHLDALQVYADWHIEQVAPRPGKPVSNGLASDTFASGTDWRGPGK